jgi:hypothetical protein
MTVSKAVYCEKCSKEIKFRGDLVTATLFFVIVAYHENCYAKELKGFRGLFLDNQTLNGFSGNFLFVMAILVGIGFAFGSMKWVSIVAVIPVLYRFFSFYKFERLLEK